MLVLNVPAWAAATLIGLAGVVDWGVVTARGQRNECDGAGSDLWLIVRRSQAFCELHDEHSGTAAPRLNGCASEGAEIDRFDVWSPNSPPQLIS
jgi:hypothetical protein